VYSLPNIIKVNKSRRIIWAGYVASMRPMTRFVFSIRDALNETGRRNYLWDDCLRAGAD
jgi:hypothetical protein